MLKNKKIIIPLALVILSVGAAYAMAKPKPATKAKIPGTIYVLPKSFLLNLDDGHYAKLTVALVLAPGQSTGSAGASGSTGSEEVTGTLPEEAAIRAIVTNLITNQSESDLMSERHRSQIEHQLLLAIRSQTDVKVEEILFPDLTLQ